MKYITEQSQIRCIHGGTVQTAGKSSDKIRINGKSVLTAEKLKGARIVGCPAFKPCTQVTEVLIGKIGNVKTDKETPLLSTLIAMTDGGICKVVGSEGASATILKSPVSAAEPQIVNLKKKADGNQRENNNNSSRTTEPFKISLKTDLTSIPKEYRSQLQTLYPLSAIHVFVAIAQKRGNVWVAEHMCILHLPLTSEGIEVSFDAINGDQPAWIIAGSDPSEISLTSFSIPQSVHYCIASSLKSDHLLSANNNGHKTKWFNNLDEIAKDLNDSKIPDEIAKDLNDSKIPVDLLSSIHQLPNTFKSPMPVWRVVQIPNEYRSNTDLVLKPIHPNLITLNIYREKCRPYINSVRNYLEKTKYGLMLLQIIQDPPEITDSTAQLILDNLARDVKTETMFVKDPVMITETTQEITYKYEGFIESYQKQIQDYCTEIIKRTDEGKNRFIPEIWKELDDYTRSLPGTLEFCTINVNSRQQVTKENLENYIYCLNRCLFNEARILILDTLLLTADSLNMVATIHRHQLNNDTEKWIKGTVEWLQTQFKENISEKKNILHYDYLLKAQSIYPLLITHDDQQQANRSFEQLIKWKKDCWTFMGSLQFYLNPENEWLKKNLKNLIDIEEKDRNYALLKDTSIAFIKIEKRHFRLDKKSLRGGIYLEYKIKKHEPIHTNWKKIQSKVFSIDKQELDIAGKLALFFQLACIVPAWYRYLSEEKKDVSVEDVLSFVKLGLDTADTLVHVAAVHSIHGLLKPGISNYAPVLNQYLGNVKSYDMVFQYLRQAGKVIDIFLYTNNAANALEYGQYWRGGFYLASASLTFILILPLSIPVSYPIYCAALVFGLIAMHLHETTEREKLFLAVIKKSLFGIDGYKMIQEHLKQLDAEHPDSLNVFYKNSIENLKEIDRSLVKISLKLYPVELENTFSFAIIIHPIAFDLLLSNIKLHLGSSVLNIVLENNYPSDHDASKKKIFHRIIISHETESSGSPKITSIEPTPKEILLNGFSSKVKSNCFTLRRLPENNERFELKFEKESKKETAIFFHSQQQIEKSIYLDVLCCLNSKERIEKIELSGENLKCFLFDQNQIIRPDDIQSIPSNPKKYFYERPI